MVRIGSGGRFVVPARLRKAIGLKPGDTVILRLAEEGLIVTTPARAVQAAQALVREHNAGKRSLAEELIAERKLETERG